MWSSKSTPPAGEDFIFGVQKGNFVKNVREYADGFDVDEHVELWIEGRGKNGVPATSRELVEDAEAIRDMLNELATSLEIEEVNTETTTENDSFGIMQSLRKLFYETSPIAYSEENINKLVNEMETVIEKEFQDAFGYKPDFRVRPELSFDRKTGHLAVEEIRVINKCHVNVSYKKEAT